MSSRIHLRRTDLWDAMVEYMCNSPYYKIHYGTTANIIIHYAKMSHGTITPVDSARMSDIKMAVLFCDTIGDDL